MPVMPEHKRRQKAPAGSCQRKIHIADTSDQDSHDRCQGKCHEPEFVHLGENQILLPAAPAVFCGNLFHLFIHIGLQNLRDDLHKQHHAHNAEQVGNTVPHRHQSLKVCTHRRLRRGERRSARERSREDSHQDCPEFLMVKVRKAGADQNTCHTGSRRRRDNHKPKHNIRLEIPFQVAEKVRPRNETDGGHEKDQPHVLHDLQRLCGKRLLPHRKVS